MIDTPMKLISKFLLLITLSSFSTLSVGESIKAQWLTSACYKFNLSVFEKFSVETAPVRYLVTSNSGRIFAAEKMGTSSPSTSEVVFPDDFQDAKVSGVSASVNCFKGETYKWAIYINGTLIDSGTIGFSRDKRK